jgi:hypothetical protein
MLLLRCCALRTLRLRLPRSRVGKFDVDLKIHGLTSFQAPISTTRTPLRVVVFLSTIRLDSCTRNVELRCCWKPSGRTIVRKTEDPRAVEYLVASVLALCCFLRCLILLYQHSDLAMSAEGWMTHFRSFLVLDMRCFVEIKILDIPCGPCM